MDIDTLLRDTPSEIAARWALDCAEHVIPGWEVRHPKDNRPKRACKTIRKYLETSSAECELQDIESRTRLIGVIRDTIETITGAAADLALDAAWGTVDDDAAWDAYNVAWDSEREWQLNHLRELLASNEKRA